MSRAHMPDKPWQVPQSPGQPSPALLPTLDTRRLNKARHRHACEELRLHSSPRKRTYSLVGVPSASGAAGESWACPGVQPRPARPARPAQRVALFHLAGSLLPCGSPAPFGHSPPPSTSSGHPGGATMTYAVDKKLQRPIVCRGREAQSAAQTLAPGAAGEAGLFSSAQPSDWVAGWRLK